MCLFIVVFIFYFWVRSYGVWLSPSDLFHLALYPLGPPMLLQIARFHPSLWLRSSPLCISTTSSLSICPLMDTQVASKNFTNFHKNFLHLLCTHGSTLDYLRIYASWGSKLLATSQIGLTWFIHHLPFKKGLWAKTSQIALHPQHLSLILPYSYVLKLSVYLGIAEASPWTGKTRP